MPKNGKLDRCVDGVKAGYLEKGKSKRDASSIAWAVCKEQERKRLAEKIKNNLEQKDKKKK